MQIRQVASTRQLHRPTLVRVRPLSRGDVQNRWQNGIWQLLGRADDEPNLVRFEAPVGAAEVVWGTSLSISGDVTEPPKTLHLAEPIYLLGKVSKRQDHESRPSRRLRETI